LPITVDRIFHKSVSGDASAHGWEPQSLLSSPNCAGLLRSSTVEMAPEGAPGEHLPACCSNQQAGFL
jgi:hypothetical protein